jgi:multisubunit Na+/H+ antiporter MnhC subunit
MSAVLESLLWLVGITLLMLLLKRWIHRHVQGIGLLLTRDPDRAFLLYSLLLFPGTVVHESAHSLMAIFLDVPVRKFSLVPAKQPRGMMRLGFVEIDHTDTVREALIGFAPLLAGSIVVLLLAPHELPTVEGATSLTAQLSALLASVPRALAAADFWLLLYLIFAISNGMLPSESDRQAWGPVLIWFGVILLLVYLSGLVSSIPEQVAQEMALVVDWLVRAFVLTCLVDVCFIPFIFVVEKILELFTQQRVRY